jgi:dephospho-CoA kinase
MKRIGITGGIGSGKTTVCEIFKLLGIPVFHADLEARFLQNNDQVIKKQIVEHFGEKIYNKDGRLDRKKMASLIFSRPEELEAINSIIHPAVRQRYMKWCITLQDPPYSLYEAAILFESGYEADFDMNILVFAEERIRIDRVINRDQTTEEIVKKRISNQMSDIDKLSRADFIIENNNNSLLIPQIIKIDNILRDDGKVW